MQIKTITKMSFTGSSHGTTVPMEILKDKLPEVYEEGKKGRIFWKEDSNGRIIVDFDIVDEEE